MIPSSLVFIARKHVFAAMHPRGLTKGHVIVCPVRPVAHFAELTELETLEVFVCSQQITKAFEDRLKFKSFTILIQDGVAAAQTLPRQPPQMMSRAGAASSRDDLHSAVSDGMSLNLHMHIIPIAESGSRQSGPNKLKLEDAPERDPAALENEAAQLRSLFL